MIFFHDK